MEAKGTISILIIYNIIKSLTQYFVIVDDDNNNKKKTFQNPCFLELEG